MALDLRIQQHHLSSLLLLRSNRLSRVRSVIVGLVILIIIGGAVHWNAPQAFDAGQARPAAPSIPVNVAPVSRKDVPVFLTGLGTVQASLTVAIHAQVEGVLQEVLFIEGQQVKKGDVLARIEPRLFLAALGQAKAKKAQDAALLVAAE